MIKFKRLVAFSMIGILAVGMCACGKKKERVPETAEEQTEESTEEKMPDEEGDPIFVYSYNSDLGDKLAYFYELYPQYKDRVQFVDLDMGAASKEYQQTIRSLMKQGPNKIKKETMQEGSDDPVVEEVLPQYPSIVANDSVMGYAFIQNDYSVPVSSLGITQEDMEQMYPYTLQAASFQDEVKGLAYNVTPGAFMYRADIAWEVLGVSAPEDVQAQISSWNDFLQVAKKMKEAGYKMLSGADEITYAMLQNRQTPWVVDENLRMDSNVKKCMELSGKLLEGEYTGDTTITSEERASSFTSDVFGWFVYPGTVYGGVEAGDHVGDFRICQGPNAYQWGSTYLTVSPDCPDKELAALVVKTLCCNEEVLAKIADENEFVNNKAVMENKAENTKGLKLLDGQKPLSVWLDVEDSIDADKVTPYDGRFDSWIQELSVSVNKGVIPNVKKALVEFKDRVSDTFNYIKVN